MSRTEFFFKQNSFGIENIQQYYYEYKGYFQKLNGGKIRYPITLHFGKDEVVFSWRCPKGSVTRVFSLYVAPGELNQTMLTEKIQHYWKMGFWIPPFDQDYDTEKNTQEHNSNVTSDIYVNKELLSISYFSSFYEFDLIDNRFQRCKLFRKTNFESRILKNGTVLQFHNKSQPDNYTSWYIVDDNSQGMTCEITTGDDKHTSKISFRKIILDFLFELDNAETFEDQNFFKLQPELQNNKLLDALSRKCCYLDELCKLRPFMWTTPDKRLPKRFSMSEKSWLNVCFQEQYQKVFTHPDSIFEAAEDEAKLVLFKTRIGTFRRSRSQFFSKDDANLRNKAATFFLERYSLYNAFKSLVSPVSIFLLPLIFFLIPVGDLFLDQLATNKCPKFGYFTGVFSAGFPLFFILFIFVKYAVSRINLFKLVLPRLFLGIMFGWFVFASTEELWKAALFDNAAKTLIVNILLFVILFLYIATDIRNKLVRQTDKTVLSRTFGIILLAMLISFMQGFYIIQLRAKPIIENSGILNDLEMTQEHNVDAILGKYNKKIHSTDLETSHSVYDGKFGFLSNFHVIKLFNKNIYLRYIWSIHLSQFMLSILIGVVLQLLWEDRPITQPL